MRVVRHLLVSVSLAMMAVVAEECAGAELLDPELFEKWMAHRNDVPGRDVERDGVERGQPAETDRDALHLEY